MRRLLQSCLLAVCLLVPQTLRPATASSADGRALFHGYTAFKAGTAATKGGLPLEFVACANCHGSAGEGRSEGGERVPAVQFAELVRPKAGRPGYDAAGIMRALTQGEAPGGRVLSAIMPRYLLADAEAQALVQYLKVVGTADDMPTGITKTEIRLGTLVPLSGPLSSTGYAILAGMNDAISAINRVNGIYGRKIVLVSKDSAADAKQAARLLLDENVYAVAGGLWAPDSNVEEIFSQSHVSVIAALTVRGQTSSSIWVSDLLAPRDKQDAQLALARKSCETEKTCVVFDLAQSAQLRRGIAAGLRQKISLPFPASVLGEGDLWRKLGIATAAITIEALSVSGVALNERSAIDALPRLSGFEPLPGVPVFFSRTRTYAWDPELLELEPEPTTNESPVSAAK